MTKQSKNNQQDAANIVDDIELATTIMAERFIVWKEGLHSEIRGCKLMFDVPKHYKWLEESELMNHFVDHIYYE